MSPPTCLLTFFSHFMKNLILSLFPGIDLLGRGFESAGYDVVRGPDLLWGQDICDYHAPAGAFEGIIGGPPCQDFSRARRSAPSGDGDRGLVEFTRVVTEARPDWFVLENVPGVPDVGVAGYRVQRLNLNARECGCEQNRLRTFQFGSIDGIGIVIRRRERRPRAVTPCCMASEGNRAGRRTWKEFVSAQGLPPDFDLPGWSLAMKYRAVGNGVPLPMGRVVAIAIQHRRVTAHQRVCVCGCGRPVEGNAIHGGAGCRKRMERRRRVTPGVTLPRPVTPAASHGACCKSS